MADFEQQQGGATLNDLLGDLKTARDKTGSPDSSTPAPTLAPPPSTAGPHMDYDELASRAATKYGLEPALVRAMMHQESGGNPRATSNKGAQGLMQLMPATAKMLGVTDPYDPEQNVDAGTRHMKSLMTKYKGDPRLALAAYNSGEGAVDLYNGIPPYAETQNYVSTIMGRYQPQSQPQQPGTIQDLVSDLARARQSTNAQLAQQQPAATDYGPKFGAVNPVLYYAKKGLDVLHKPVEWGEKAVNWISPEVDWTQYPDWVKDRPWLVGTAEFVRGSGKSTAQEGVKFISDPLNWPFLAIGMPQLGSAGAVRPLMRAAVDTFFGAMMANGAYQGFQQGDYSGAAMNAAFGLMGLKGLHDNIRLIEPMRQFDAASKETFGKPWFDLSNSQKDTVLQKVQGGNRDALLNSQAQQLFGTDDVTKLDIPQRTQAEKEALAQAAQQLGLKVPQTPDELQAARNEAAQRYADATASWRNGIREAERQRMADHLAEQRKAGVAEMAADREAIGQQKGAVLAAETVAQAPEKRAPEGQPVVLNVEPMNDAERAEIRHELAVQEAWAILEDERARDAEIAARDQVRDFRRVQPEAPAPPAEPALAPPVEGEVGGMKVTDFRRTERVLAPPPSTEAEGLSKQPEAPSIAPVEQPKAQLGDLAAQYQAAIDSGDTETARKLALEMVVERRKQQAAAVQSEPAQQPEAPKLAPPPTPKEAAVEEGKQEAAKPPKRGGENTVFTEERYKAALAKLQKYSKGEQFNAGIDPEAMMALIDVGGYHFERGIRDFAGWSAAVVSDLTDWVQPHLQMIYDAVKEAVAREQAEKTPPEVKAAGETLKAAKREAKLADAAETMREGARRAGSPEKADDMAQAAAELDRRAAKAREERADAERRYKMAVGKPTEQPLGREIPLLAQGRATKVIIDSGLSYPAHYAVIREADLAPSHEPDVQVGNWKQNENAFQPRTGYGDNVDKQRRIIMDSQSVDERVLTDDPTAANGPSIIRKDGLVAGGNRRAMLVRLAYKQGLGANYYETLKAKAQTFGIDPAQIPPYGERPVLVRVLDDVHTDTSKMFLVGDHLNKMPSEGYSAAEKSASAARYISDDDFAWVASFLSEGKEGRTLAELMTEKAEAVKNLMLKSGMVRPSEQDTYFDPKTKMLTDAGKSLFRQAVLGRVLSDSSLAQRVESEIPSIGNKVERSIDLWARIAARKDSWNFIKPYLDEALRLHLRVKSAQASLDEIRYQYRQFHRHEKGVAGLPTSNIELYLHEDRYPVTTQTMDFGEGSIRDVYVSPIGEALAKLLEDKQASIRERLGAYIKAAEITDVPDQGGFSFFEAADPWDVFNNHIGKPEGVEVSRDEWGRVAPAPEKPAGYTGEERRQTGKAAIDRRAMTDVRLGQLREELGRETDPEKKAEIQYAINREIAIARGEKEPERPVAPAQQPESTVPQESPQATLPPPPEAASVFETEVQPGDRIHFFPANTRRGAEPVEGAVVDIIKNTEGGIGYNLHVPAEGDEGRTIRVWAGDGAITKILPDGNEINIGRQERAEHAAGIAERSNEREKPEGKKLPEPPQTAGTAEGAQRDTDLFAKAKEELGPGASISDVARRAQELKEGKTLTPPPERKSVLDIKPEERDVVDKRNVEAYGKQVAAEQQRLLDKEIVSKPLQDGVTVFASGANRAAEIRGFEAAGIPVGVDVSELSEESVNELARVAKKAPVFLDSGAFGEVAVRNGKLDLNKPISDNEWKERLGTYKRIADAGGVNVSVVAPDMVGNQAKTLERLEKFREDLKEIEESGARIVVPIQGGEMSPVDFYREVRRTLDGYVDLDNLIPALPMKKAAMDPAAAVDFVEKTSPQFVHLLGMGADSQKADALVKALRHIDPDIEITMDSNRLRALAGTGRELTETQRAHAQAVADKIAEDFYHEVDLDEYGAGKADYTENIYTLSNWANATDLRKIADFLKISKADWPTFQNDPDGFIASHDIDLVNDYTTAELEKVYKASLSRSAASGVREKAVAETFDKSKIAGQTLPPPPGKEAPAFYKDERWTDRDTSGPAYRITARSEWEAHNKEYPGNKRTEEILKKSKGADYVVTSSREHGEWKYATAGDSVDALRDWVRGKGRDMGWDFDFAKSGEETRRVGEEQRVSEWTKRGQEPPPADQVLKKGMRVKDARGRLGTVQTDSEKNGYAYIEMDDEKPGALSWKASSVKIVDEGKSLPAPPKAEAESPEEWDRKRWNREVAKAYNLGHPWADPDAYPVGKDAGGRANQLTLHEAWNEAWDRFKPKDRTVAESQLAKWKKERDRELTSYDDVLAEAKAAGDYVPLPLRSSLGLAYAHLTWSNSAIDTFERFLRGESVDLGVESKPKKALAPPPEKAEGKKFASPPEAKPEKKNEARARAKEINFVRSQLEGIPEEIKQNEGTIGDIDYFIKRSAEGKLDANDEDGLMRMGWSQEELSELPEEEFRAWKSNKGEWQGKLHPETIKWLEDGKAQLQSEIDAAKAQLPELEKRLAELKARGPLPEDVAQKHALTVDGEPLRKEEGVLPAPPTQSGEPKDRADIVDALGAEYQKNGQEAAKKLFDKFIKKYELSQHAIKTIIGEFREKYAPEEPKAKLPAPPEAQSKWPEGVEQLKEGTSVDTAFGPGRIHSVFPGGSYIVGTETSGAQHVAAEDVKVRPEPKIPRPEEPKEPVANALWQSLREPSKWDAMRENGASDAEIAALVGQHLDFTAAHDVYPYSGDNRRSVIGHGGKNLRFEVFEGAGDKKKKIADLNTEQLVDIVREMHQIPERGEGPAGGELPPPQPHAAETSKENRAVQDHLNRAVVGGKGIPVDEIARRVADEDVPTVVLARHGTTSLNGRNGKTSAERIRGWSDIDLDKDGIKDAERLGQQLKNVPVDRIITSDLKRAVHTGEILSEATGKPIESRYELRPWNLGDFTAKEVPGIKDKLEYYIQHPDELVPGGESYNEFLQRYSGGLQQVLKEAEETGKTPVIVAHSRNMLAVPNLLSGGKEPIAPNGGPSPGDAVLLEKGGQGWQLAEPSKTRTAEAGASPKTGAEKQGAQLTSKSALRTQLAEAFPRTTPEQREGAMILMEMRAKAMGVPLDEFLKKHIAGIEKGGKAGPGALAQARRAPKGIRWTPGDPVEDLRFLMPDGNGLKATRQSATHADVADQAGSTMTDLLRGGGIRLSTLGKSLQVEVNPSNYPTDAQMEQLERIAPQFGRVVWDITDASGNRVINGGEGKLDDFKAALDRYVRPRYYQESDQPVWLDKLSEVADAKVKGPMTPDQLKATLKNNGVKDDQLEAMGFDQFVEGKKKISPEELNDFVRSNSVQLVDVVHRDSTSLDKLDPKDIINWEEQPTHEVRRPYTFGGAPRAGKYPAEVWSGQTENGERYEIVRHPNVSGHQFETWRLEEGKPVWVGLFENYHDAQLAAQQEVAGMARGNVEGLKFPPSQYSSVWIPGGDEGSHMEFLLQVPTKERSRDEMVREIERAGYGVDQSRDRRRFDLQDSDGHWLTDEERANLPDNLRETLAKLEGKKEQTFEAGHWDEPNILVNVLADDQTIDGKKYLRIHEVQSDWHRIGRKQGYKPADIEKQARAAAERMHEIVPVLRKYLKDADALGYDSVQQAMDDIGAGRLSADAIDKSENPELIKTAREYRAAIEETTRLAKLNAGAPEAPFKSNWYEPALKRMIRYAAENGYDGILLTNGDYVKDKYDLSKKIDRIDVAQYKDEPGYIRIQLAPRGYTAHDIHGAIAQRIDGVELASTNWLKVPVDKLDQVTGKEVADRILERIDSKRWSKDLRGNPQVREDSLHDVDLKVGGEWANNLYDRAIPNFLKQYTKKWSGKVEEAKVPGKVKPLPRDMRPEIREAAKDWIDGNLSIEELNDRLGTNYTEADADRFPGAGDVDPHAYGNRDLNAFVRTLEEGVRASRELGNVAMHKLDLTPEMRDAVMQGQYLFQGGNKGVTEFLKDGRAIIRGFEGGDVSTLVHESAHVFRRTLSPEELETANGLWTKGGKWNVDAEERFARDFERYLYDGQAPSPAAKIIFAKFRGWLQDVYKRLIGSPIAEKITAEKRAFFDQMLGFEKKTEEPASEPRTRPPAPAKAEVPARAPPVEPEKQAARPEVQPQRPAPAPDAAAPKAGVLAPPPERAPRSASSGDIPILAGPPKQEARKSLLVGPSGEELTYPSREEAVNAGRTEAKARTLPQPPKTQETPYERMVRERQTRASLPPPPVTKEAASAPAVPTPTSRIIIPPGFEREEEPVRRPPARPAREIPNGRAGAQEPVGAGRVPEPAGEPRGVVPKLPEPAPAIPAGRRGESGAESVEREKRKALRGVEDIAMAKPRHERGQPLYDPERWRQALKLVNLPENLPVPTERLDEPIRQMLYPGQRLAAEVALTALKEHDATSLAVTTGGGKTFIGSALFAQLKPKYGLILVPQRDLLKDWKNTASGYFGVDVKELDDAAPDKPGIYITTYAAALNKRTTPERQGIDTFPWDLAFTDESTIGRGWHGAEHQTGEIMMNMGEHAKKMVYSSATPWHTPLEVGYANKLGLWDHTDFEHWAKPLGVRRNFDANGKATWSSPLSPRKMEKLRQQLVERGQMITMDKDMTGYSAHFGVVPLTSKQTEQMNNARRAFAMARSYFKQQKLPGLIRAAKAMEAVYIKNYLERARLPQAIELGKRLEDAGYKVIFFTENKGKPELEEDEKAFNDHVYDFMKDADKNSGGEISRLLTPLPSVVETLERAFPGDIANYSGSHSAERSGEKDAFNRGEKKHIYTTYAAGGVGVSLHDTEGDAPRAAVHIGLPWSGVALEQSVGRPWRFGTKSNVAAYFLSSDAGPEVNLITKRVGPRLASLRAGVSGIKPDAMVAAMHNPDAFLDYSQGGTAVADTGDFLNTADARMIAHHKNVPVIPASEQMGPDKGMKIPNPEETPELKFLFQSGGDDAVNRVRKDAVKAMDTSKLAPPPSEATSSTFDQVHSILAGVPQISSLSKPDRAALADAVSANAAFRAAGAAGDGGDPTPAIVGAWRDAMDHVRDVGELGKKASMGVNLMYLTSGRNGIRKVGGPVGEAVANDIVDYHLEWGHVGGPLQVKAYDINEKYKLSKDDFRQVWNSVENDTPLNDPRLDGAKKEVRALLNDVRVMLHDADVKTEVYKNNQRVLFPITSEERPNYMPHRYPREVLQAYNDLRQAPTEEARNKAWDRAVRSIMSSDGVDRAAAEQTLAAAGIRSKILGKRHDAFVERLMQRNGVDRATAETMASDLSRGVPLAANVERPREIDLPGYRKDLGALLDYLDDAAEVAARTKVFGQFREKLSGKLSMLEDPKSIDFINDVVSGLLDRKNQPDTASAMARAAADWTIWTKMLYSALPNASQWVNASLRSNTRASMKALGYTMSHLHDATRAAMGAGVITEHARADLMRELGVARPATQKFLETTGFLYTDLVGRVIAYHTGRIFLEDYALPKLIKNPDSTYRRILKQKYSLSDQAIDAAIERKAWTPDDLRRAGKRLSDDTQFTNDPTEKPPGWSAQATDIPSQHNNALVRIASLLKSYAFKQSALITDALWREARKGNFRPLIPFAVLFPAVGELVADLSQTVRATPGVVAAVASGDDEKMKKAAAAATERFRSLADLSPDDKWALLRRYVENIGHVGGIGLAGSVIDAASWGKIPEFLVGPAITDLATVGTGAANMAQTVREGASDGQVDTEKLKNQGKGVIRRVLPATKPLIPPPER